MATKIYSRAYELTKVLTASNREVVLYLYEGALNFLNRALEARDLDDQEVAGKSIDQTISILIELSCCLDYSRNGSLALRLDSIYNYMIEVLTLSSKTKSEEPIKTCEGILTILGDAWRQAIAMDKKNEPEIAEPVRLQVSA